MHLSHHHYPTTSDKSTFNKSVLSVKKEKKYDTYLRLYNTLLPMGEPFILKKGEKIKNEDQNNYIWVISEGHCTLSRRIDGMVLNTYFSPFIFGLTNIFLPQSHYILTADSDCYGTKLLTNTLFNCSSTLPIWKDITVVLSFITHLLMARDDQLIGVNAYTMIRHKLCELMDYPEKERLKINVQEFIHQRTPLSRSGILKILSDLRTGDFVTIKRGRLLSVNHLPAEY